MSSSNISLNQDLFCPLMGTVFVDAQIWVDGFSYEKFEQPSIANRLINSIVEDSDFDGQHVEKAREHAAAAAFQLEEEAHHDISKKLLRHLPKRKRSRSPCVVGSDSQGYGKK